MGDLGLIVKVWEVSNVIIGLFNGKTSAGQIHLEETGLALIPGVDEYEIVK